MMYFLQDVNVLIVLFQTMLKHINNVVFFWGGGGGVTQERFSNVCNNRSLSSREITGKTLSARKSIIGNITLSQTSRLNLDKVGIDNSILDC